MQSCSPAAEMVLWSPLVENWQEQPFNVTFLLLLYSSYYFICIKNVWLLINLWLHSGLDLLHFSRPLQDKVWKMHTCHTGHGILCKFESGHSFSGEQQLFPGMVPKPGKQNLSFLASNYIEIVRGSLSVTVAEMLLLSLSLLSCSCCETEHDPKNSYQVSW